ncbi:hypothetical protein [Streptomyces sp. NPDC049881]|uniref:hypothetical protein n=1 Tax=Streptomyces sp. NPDC049881 TaxID=3155778 RepID=UPI0034316BF0
MRDRLAALMAATSVATGMAAGFAAQAQASEAPAASYEGRPSGEADGRVMGHGDRPCNCGPTTIIADKSTRIGNGNTYVNNQTLLPILSLILPTMAPTEGPTTTTTDGTDPTPTYG